MKVRPRTTLKREHPRMALNKLGEYMVANAARRERIVTNQKYPQQVRTVRYNEAQEAITDYMVSGATDDKNLNREIERLRTNGSADTWKGQNSLLCANAIVSFRNVVNDLNKTGELIFTRGEPTPPKLHIGDVEVSVRPEIIVTRKNRFGDQCVGAVKLYFPKTHPLGKEAGEYVASTVHHFLNEYPQIPGNPDYKLCAVVDVSAGDVFWAPLAYRRRRTEIEAACREIARAWGSA